MDSLYGFRKIAAAIVIVGVASALVYFHGDVPPGMQEVLQWVFAAFVLGNSVEHVTDAVSSVNASPSVAQAAVAPPADLSALRVMVSSLASDIAEVKMTDAESKQSLSLIVDTLGTIIRRTGIDKMPEPGLTK